jgi:AcrR family transcriptional regulator
MRNQRELLPKIIALLMRYGARSLTMDDVARQLGISKKTLYTISSNKADLVNRCCAFHFEGERNLCASLEKNSEDAIDYMLNIIHYLCENLTGINPSLIYDLQKYYPEAWKQFESYKHEYLYGNIKRNMERGIRAGLYRQDFRTDVVAKFYIGRLEMLHDIELFPRKKYPLPLLYREYLLHHLRSIVSPRGASHLEKLIKRKKVK